MYLNCSMFTKTSTTAAIRTLKKREKWNTYIFNEKLYLDDYSQQILWFYYMMSSLPTLWYLVWCQAKPDEWVGNLGNFASKSFQNDWLTKLSHYLNWKKPDDGVKEGGWHVWWLRSIFLMIECVAQSV